MCFKLLFFLDIVTQHSIAVWGGGVDSETGVAVWGGVDSEAGVAVWGGGGVRQGKFIYIAHFIHSGNSKCFT